MTEYGDFSPIADKILNPDGSVTSILTGTEVEAANAAGAALYLTYAPKAAKYLLPNGSTVSAVPLQAIIAGTATAGYSVVADGSGGLEYTDIAALVNALVYKGVIDCSTTPNYPAASAGHVYIVSVAGKIGGASGAVVTAGDMLLCKTDGTVAGTEAAVGAQWDIVEKNIDLTNLVISGGSINGTPIGGTVQAAGNFTSLELDTMVMPSTPVVGQVLKFSSTAGALVAADDLGMTGGFSGSYKFCEDPMFSGANATPIAYNAATDYGVNAVVLAPTGYYWQSLQTPNVGHALAENVYWTRAWHELEVQSDGGSIGMHTVTTGNNTWVELDRYYTGALGSTIIPAGNWRFDMWCMSSAANDRQQIKAEIYKIAADKSLSALLATATSLTFANTIAAIIRADIFLAEQAALVTDGVAVIVSGRRTDNRGTLTWYHDKTLGFVSEMTTPISLLHNQMNGLNQGAYQHLPASTAASDFPVGEAGTGKWVKKTLAETQTILIPNVSNTTLSGTPKVFTLYDGATPYYIKAYPTKV